MKASAFTYTRASTTSEALRLLAEHGDEAKILSGGQSLMPALNLRLLSPSILIDINSISELRGIAVTDGGLRIGALTRHVELLNSSEVAEHAPLLIDAAAHIGHPAIRNMGTIGGSLCHADPASELPACMLALDATIVVRGLNGERYVEAADFFTGIYETALSDGEILMAVIIPRRTARSAHFFKEHSRRAGDYALVGLSACALLADNKFADLRLSFFAVGDKPMLVRAAQHLIGVEVTDAVLLDAHKALDSELDPQDDQQASAAMRYHLARHLLSSCVATLLRSSDAVTIT